MEPPSLKDLRPDPLDQFTLWYSKVQRSGSIKNPGATCLSTVDAAGLPDGRMVIVRRFDSRGFVFYTDGRSPKATALTRTPWAALTFYWEHLDRQVRIRGRARQVAPGESEAYFRTRPRKNRIAAWASKQSHPLERRSVLEERMERLTARYEGRSVPMPDHWVGFRIVPMMYEFWQSGAFRLHHRYLYRREGGRWRITILQP